MFDDVAFVYRVCMHLPTTITLSSVIFCCSGWSTAAYYLPRTTTTTTPRSYRGRRYSQAADRVRCILYIPTLLYTYIFTVVVVIIIIVSQLSSIIDDSRYLMPCDDRPVIGYFYANRSKVDSRSMINEHDRRVAALERQVSRFQQQLYRVYYLYFDYTIDITTTRC